MRDKIRRGGGVKRKQRECDSQKLKERALSPGGSAMNENQELSALEELEAELNALEEFTREVPPAPEPEVVKPSKPKPAKAKAQKREEPKPEPTVTPEVRLYGADKLRAKRGR